MRRCVLTMLIFLLWTNSKFSKMGCNRHKVRICRRSCG
jgi:hypothetical protein